jgi:hypothetical protein
VREVVGGCGAIRIEPAIDFRRIAEVRRHHSDQIRARVEGFDLMRELDLRAVLRARELVFGDAFQRDARDLGVDRGFDLVDLHALARRGLQHQDPRRLGRQYVHRHVLRDLLFVHERAIETARFVGRDDRRQQIGVHPLRVTHLREVIEPIDARELDG